MSLKYKVWTIALIILFQTGCKKLVEVDAPVTSINSANVFNNDVTAAAALTGIYGKMSQANNTSNPGITSTSFYLGLSADEFTLYSGAGVPGYTQVYQNALTSSSSNSVPFWGVLYSQIFQANAAVAGLTQSVGLTPAVKQELLGEAKFIRAFSYINLISLYGDVPLVTGTDYNLNASLARAPKSQVWLQVIQDLKDAQAGLNAGYVGADGLTPYPAGSEQRVRPDKWAATALLARAYLYTGQYADASAQASAVINQTTLYNLQPLNSVFLASSMESIWQLQPVVSGHNTEDAQFYIIPDGGPAQSHPVYLSTFLLNSFEAGDARRTNWVSSVAANGNTYYFPFKYKVFLYGAPVTEYLTVLRLAEQYLIRAEARAQLGDLGGAAADLNTIRARAQLGATSANTQASLLNAILHERQVEFFSEWGHRWLDLKRTNTVDAVMGTPGGVCAAKGGSWSSNWALYPIPASDIQNDPHLTQNPGY